MAAEKTVVTTSFYHLSLLTFFVSFIWIAIGMYMAFKNPVEIQVKPEMLKPINPTIDTKTMESLQQRLSIAKDVDQVLQLDQASAESTPIPTPEPSISPEPTSTPSASPSEEESPILPG